MKGIKIGLLLLLVKACMVVDAQPPDYHDELLIFVEKTFFDRDGMFEIANIVFLKEDSIGIHFFIEESANHPRLDSLPIWATQLHDKFLYFWDHRYPKLTSKEFIYPLYEGKAIFSTGAKIVYLILKKEDNGYITTIGDIDDGLVLIIELDFRLRGKKPPPIIFPQH